MNKRLSVAISAFMLIFEMVCSVQAQSPQETLNQYIADLQKNPNDYAMREKIIKLAQTMKPAPAIPEEARRNYVMAKTLFKDAKNIQDYNDALVKFKAALLAAPWWADAYLDMGLAYEEAQQYAEAINALKLYVVANPDSEKARKAQDEIYIIEAKKEKAAKESSPQAVAAREQKKSDDWLKKLDGRRYFLDDPGGGAVTIDVRGKFLQGGVIRPPRFGGGYHEYPNEHVEILGRETTSGPLTFIISENGDRITKRTLMNNGQVIQWIFFWRESPSK